MTITEAAMVIQEFQKGSLSDTIADLEIGLRASGLAECKSRLGSQKINNELLTAALLLKREADQINQAECAFQRLLYDSGVRY